jgi:predicted N-formylglutamate amidohydrolase
VIVYVMASVLAVALVAGLVYLSQRAAERRVRRAFGPLHAALDRALQSASDLGRAEPPSRLCSGSSSTSTRR